MNGFSRLSILVSALLSGCVSTPPGRAGLTVSARAFDGSQEVFQPRAEYLQLVLPYPPVRELFNELERREGISLRNRGEAHITVITPPEYAVLSKHISIDQINEIARAEKIQQARVESLCLGAGQAQVDGRPEQTFFVVVRSPELTQLRAKIHERFLRAGGASGSFDPNRYYPHITLGFTKSDLHEAQGVIKGENSCRYSLHLK